MDILIKQNIIKKSKVLVDIGSHFTKLVCVSYSGGKISVDSVKKLDSALFLNDDGTLDYSELAKTIDKTLTGKKRSTVSVSLPTEMVPHKVVTIKNRKAADIPKIIEKEYSVFGKVSPMTHEIDYAYLGKRDESGDSVHYCMVAAVNKNAASMLADEFLKRKLRITTVSFDMYDLACLAQLFANDYEHMNKLLIDFGNNGTRVVAIAEGNPVYVRNIDIGFKTYLNAPGLRQIEPFVRAEILTNVGEMKMLTSGQMRQYFDNLSQDEYFTATQDVSRRLSQEIFRVLELCENNDAPITKIICCGRMLNGFERYLKRPGITIEKFALGADDETAGKDFALTLRENLDSSFGNAVGLSIHTLM